MGLSGLPARSVLLVGHAGASPWPYFQAWLATQPPEIENPLDTWSREVIGQVAAEFGGRAVSPSDRPFLPFQQWAMRAEGLRASPLGILIHPVYGLWHAYRGALLFDDPIEIEQPGVTSHPCDECIAKPCLNSCPVEAFTASGFAFQACVGHLRSRQGRPCRDKGCVARNACPVGTAYRYPPEMQAFHISKFIP